MKSKSGKPYQTEWSGESLLKLQELHDFIAFAKQEPESAQKLLQQLIHFGDQLGTAPLIYPLVGNT